MSKIREYRVARDKLEQAVSSLIRKASDFPDKPEPWQTRQLLAQAREYSRALTRLETMRGR